MTPIVAVAVAVAVAVPLGLALFAALRFRRAGRTDRQVAAVLHALRGFR